MIGGLDWRSILLALEFKDTAKTAQEKAESTMSSGRSHHVSTIVEKHKHTSPYTTEFKEGSKTYLNPRLQAARYGANVLSASMPLRRFVPAVVVRGTRVEVSVVDPSNICVSPEANSAEGFEILVAILIAASSCGSHALGFEPSFVADTEFPTKWNDAMLEDFQPTASDSSDDQEPETFGVQLSGPNLAERSIPVAEDKVESTEVATRPVRALFAPTSVVREGTLVVRSGAATKVAVKVSWERAGQSEATTIQRIETLNVPNTVKLIGHKVVASLAAGDFRSRYLAAFRSHDLHPEVDNRFLHIKIMSNVVTLLAHVQDLRTFLLALLSLLKGRALFRSLAALPGLTSASRS